MGEDSDGLVSFLFYVVIVYPTTSWLLRRFPSGKDNRGIFLAIGFLSMIAVAKTYLDVRERGPSFYRLLGVTRSSNPLEVKRAYKKMSLELHPDKNPSPTATEEFDRLKDAYDVLMNTEQRDIYNKFGEDGIKSNKVVDEYQVLLEIGIFYLTWAMLAYILTLGKSSANSRNWIYTGQIVMLVVEVSLMFQDVKLPEWFFPSVTEYEIIWLLHSLFPAYMNGCRCLGSFLFVDLDDMTRNLLLELKNQNDVLLHQLRDIQASINSQNSRGGSSSNPKATLTPSDKIKEFAALKQQGVMSPTLAAQIKQDSPGTQNAPGGNGFYLMIFGYIVLYYLFS